MLFDAHTRGFAALGIARKARTINERFNALCAHYQFEARLLQRRLGLGEGASLGRTSRTAVGACGRKRCRYVGEAWKS